MCVCVCVCVENLCDLCFVFLFFLQQQHSLGLSRATQIRTPYKLGSTEGGKGLWSSFNLDVGTESGPVPLLWFNIFISAFVAHK